MTDTVTDTAKQPMLSPYRGAYRNEPDEDTATQTGNPDATATGNPSATSSGPDLNPEERTYKTRYDALKAHYDQTVVKDRSRISELETQLSKASMVNPSMPKTAEELAQWKNSYPDLYGILVTAIRHEFKSQEEAINTRLEHVEETSRHARRERAETALLRLHPDFPELRVNQDFHDWVKEQPKTIQDWLYENEDDPLMAARAIDLYKADKGLKSAPVKSQKRQPDLRDAARNVSVTSSNVVDAEASQGKIWKTSEIARLSRQEFEKLEDEIDKARREGRLQVDK